MLSIRLVASDLDGTLLRTGGSLSEYSRDVLQRAQARHVRLVLVTGRPVRLVRELARSLGLEGVVICGNGAVLFDVRERGFLREGYHADLVLVDPHTPHVARASEVLSKCGWTPFDGHTFRSTIAATFVNGHLAWHEGRLDDSVRGQRLAFAR